MAGNQFSITTIDRIQVMQNLMILYVLIVSYNNSNHRTYKMYRINLSDFIQNVYVGYCLPLITMDM